MKRTDHGLTWLPFLPQPPVHTLKTPRDMARAELDQARELLSGRQVDIDVNPDLGDGFTLTQDGAIVHLCGGESGVLYGAYRLLMALKARQELPLGSHAPYYALRMLNCWDNAEGTIERGYSGRSLFFEDGHLDYDPVRMRQLGRMLASVGINVLCINNVNVHNPAHKLIEEEWLPQLSDLASIFRPFGVRMMLSIDYAHPLRHGLDTADPLDARVAAWWQERADIVYRYVPDLAGFLVKADSEHRPGPFTYGRTHADGANMLARALAPHGGRLIWRCFVYNCLQDWRDTVTDRPMAAYQHYAHLDGQFEDNVILQIKNGPFDFQVREPVSPLFYAMPKTNLALEVQLAQEYTGQQIDIYAMGPMWKEIFDDLPPQRVMAMAAVSNLGRDANYTGHPFAAVNLFAYGMTAWDPSTDPAALIRLWCRLTYDLEQAQEGALHALLMGSRRVYEKYTAPLGLCWMVNPHGHYGPSPSGYEYALWGTYHKANRDAVGVDRTEKNGTGMTRQYPEPLRSLYENLDTCPDLLKLFFHRLRYDYVMADGRTLIQRIYDDHFEGYDETEALAQTLRALDLPSPDREVALERMDLQLKNAREWRDVTNTFFYRLSGAKDAKGRRIYD
ncbi:MAG: alpha-glucuronidase [Clostridiales bacterium]|nr:alpha-glucuronidase [Clostridiales bacterium]